MQCLGASFLGLMMKLFVCVSLFTDSPLSSAPIQSYQQAHAATFCQSLRGIRALGPKLQTTAEQLAFTCRSWYVYLNSVMETVCHIFSSCLLWLHSHAAHRNASHLASSQAMVSAYPLLGPRHKHHCGGVYLWELRTWGVSQQFTLCRGWLQPQNHMNMYVCQWTEFTAAHSVD
jgi:hypothetical protein